MNREFLEALTGEALRFENLSSKHAKGLRATRGGEVSDWGSTNSVCRLLRVRRRLFQILAQGPPFSETSARITWQSGS